MLRIEHPLAPGAVRRLRFQILGLMLTTWPTLLGSLWSTGELRTQFGLTLVFTSLFLMAVIVPLVPPMSLMPRAVSLAPDGVRVEAFLGSTHLPWRAIRRIRVVSRRRRDLHSVTFLLAARCATVPVPIDMVQAPGAAERVATALAHFIPEIPRAGDTAEVRWDAGGSADGTFVIHDLVERQLGTVYWIGAAWASVSLDIPVLASRELFPDELSRAITAGAYAILAAAYFVLARRNAATIPAAGIPSTPNRWQTWVRILGLGAVAATVLILGFVLV